MSSLKIDQQLQNPHQRHLSKTPEHDEYEYKSEQQHKLMKHGKMKSSSELNLPTDDLYVHLDSAPSINGNTMYEVRLFCRHKHWSMYKTKQNIRDILTLFKTLYLMLDTTTSTIPNTNTGMSNTNSSNKCPNSTTGRRIHCDQCSSALHSYPYISIPCSFDINELSSFFNNLLSHLRTSDPKELESCNSHMGVVKIITNFLNLKDFHVLMASTNTSSNNNNKANTSACTRMSHLKNNNSDINLTSLASLVSPRPNNENHNESENENEIMAKSSKECDILLPDNNDNNNDQNDEDIVSLHSKLSSCLAEQYAAFDTYC